MPRKRTDPAFAETPAGYWSVATGRRPYTVRVREEPGRRGANVVLRYTDPATGTPTTDTLPFGVRDGERLVPERVRAAIEAGEKRSRELGLGILRAATSPRRLTWGEAWAAFLDPRSGGLPASVSAQRNYRRASVVWLNAIGRDTPYNAPRPNEVAAVLWDVKASGTPTAAEMHAKVLRTLHRWLTERAGYDDLKNPLRGLDWKKLRAGIQPRRGRYTPAEVERLLSVRTHPTLDPRFALMILAAVHTGARSAALRRMMRSGLDCPLAPAPTQEQAPHGWLLLPPLKGQDPPLVFLTSTLRAELDAALAGHLAAYEARWQTERIDYPLIPGGKLVGGVVPLRAAGHEPIGENDPKEWLAAAERLADVEHVTHRAWHGLRREWTDTVEERAGLEVTAVAGQWSDTSMVEKVYRSKTQFGKLAKAREAVEEGRLNRGQTV
jgi:hypothetical protein